MFKLVVLVLAIAAASARNVDKRQIISNPYYPRTNQHCDVVCDDESPSNFRTICGSDGVLYKTSCDYNNALCKARQNGQNLRYSSIGPECVTATTSCATLLQTTCINAPSSPFSPYNPVLPYYPNGGFPIAGTGAITGVSTNNLYQAQVCGSDGKSYGSLCQLRQTVCKTQSAGKTTTLELAHEGPCEMKGDNTTQEIDCSPYVVDLHGLAIESGAHTTLRVTPCTTRNMPICTLEGRTYYSECSYCGVLAARHRIQTGHLTAYIKHEGSCSGHLIG